MRGNDVTKTTSETPTVEMENIDAPASLLDNLGKISKENIIDNRVKRQRAKVKYSEMQGIGLNNSIVKNNLVVQMFTRMFSLMKRICRKLWEQVINFFRISNVKEKLVINSLNTLHMSIKKFPT